jgi:hypothetical protein
MSIALSQNSIEEQNLDSILKEAAEGYGDLMALSVVHKVSIEVLRARLRKLQREEV